VGDGWFFKIRGRVPRWGAIVLGSLPILAIVVAWAFFTRGPIEERAIAPSILPSPGEVAGKVNDLLTRRELLSHAGSSLRRVAIGYIVALAIVLPLGILMGTFGSVNATFEPLMTASGYVPIATLVPLTMSWFGTDELQKTMFLAAAFAIYILPLVVKAVSSVPDVYLRTVYTLGASRWQTIRHVLVPIAAPDIWHAMRLAFGVGWTYLVLTEVVVMVDGLGYLIEISRRRGPREHIYLTIVMITLIAWIADILWARIGDVLFPYRKRTA
jgi:NitT/TauT family transport system permease protein